MAEKVVAGLYKTENEVISAVRRLHEMGYTNDEISVLAKNPERFDKLERMTDIAAETPKAAAGGATAGAVTGGILGGLGALLVELGVLAIPGVGPFLAAGPIAATLGGIVAGGAVGGIVGALVGLGVDKGDAEHYEAALNNGDLLVLVKADDDRYTRVNDIFRYPEDEYYRHYERVPVHPADMVADERMVDPTPVAPLDPPDLDKGLDSTRRLLDVDGDGRVIDPHPFNHNR